MKKAMIVGLMALAGWGARQLQGAGKTDYLVVAIRNYAGVPPETLNLAEAQASKIFEKAGLIVEWWELPVSTEGKELPAADRPTVPPVAYLKLPPDSRIASLRRSSGAFGCALGADVYVFAGRIFQATEEAKASLPIALGHIMAHELGHVLLGENSHTPGGIMTPMFRPREFALMGMGSLLFTPAQAKRMRGRIRAQETAETAVPLAQK